MPILLDGKPVADAVQRELTAEVAALKRERGVTPALAVVLVGQDPASRVYVTRKRRAAAEIGIDTPEHLHPDGIAQTDLVALIRGLNRDPAVHGILVQLPLPKGLDETAVLEAIDPAKDVDGLHPENLGRLLIGNPVVVSCTPAGVMAILDHYGIALAGKKAVVIGRSRLVGKPVAQLLLARDATVTMCHSKTPDLPAVAREGDVLVVAAGRAGLVGAAHVKLGAAVVDVGINRRPDGSLTGDVDFAAVSEIAAAITPVPGGVGLTTVAMLMRNTVRACKRQTGAAA
jgi:methylenetetrahydrofolate dehydrogenase (NADP+)/methenyltetrahydrofolate cyclohydrolase